MRSKIQQVNPLPIAEHKGLDEEEYAWSLISPLPVMVFLPKHDDYIVYWNGAVMPHLLAMNLAMKNFGIFPSPSVRTAIEENYKKLYYADAFGNRQWDTFLDSEGYSVFRYMNSVMHRHIHTTLENKTPMEVLDWFNYKHAKNAHKSA